MPLKVSIELVGLYGTDRKISEIFIGREEDLKSRGAGRHKYSVSPQLDPWERLATFRHEYSDGAEVCVRKALQALEAYDKKEADKKTSSETPIHQCVLGCGNASDEPDNLCDACK